MQGKLLVLRKEQNIPQSELAKLLNITVKTYSLKERGEFAFDLDEMFKLSSYFNKPMDDIFLPRSHQNGDNAKEEK